MTNDSNKPTRTSRTEGGPHGLGDPDDKSLRKVESEVLIPKMIRDQSRKEKCSEEVAAFGKCAKDSGFLVALNCRSQNSLMKACLTKWFFDEEYREKCTEQYLQERAEFRRTGLTKKQRLNN